MSAPPTLYTIGFVLVDPGGVVHEYTYFEILNVSLETNIYQFRKAMSKEVRETYSTTMQLNSSNCVLWKINQPRLPEELDGTKFDSTKGEKMGNGKLLSSFFPSPDESLPKNHVHIVVLVPGLGLDFLPPPDLTIINTPPLGDQQSQQSQLAPSKPELTRIPDRPRASWDDYGYLAITIPHIFTSSRNFIPAHMGLNNLEETQSIKDQKSELLVKEIEWDDKDIEKNLSITNMAKLIEAHNDTFPYIDSVLIHYRYAYDMSLKPQTGSQLALNCNNVLFAQLRKTLQIQWPSLKYLQNQPISGPLLVRRKKDDSLNSEYTYEKFTPMPNFAILYPNGFPCLAIEVMSQSDKTLKEKHDFIRMIVYCACYVRFAHFIWSNSSKEPGTKFNFDQYAVYVTDLEISVWRVFLDQETPEAPEGEPLPIKYCEIAKYDHTNPHRVIAFLSWVYQVTQNNNSLGPPKWFEGSGFAAFTKFQNAVGGLAKSLTSSTTTRKRKPQDNCDESRELDEPGPKKHKGSDPDPDSDRPPSGGAGSGGSQSGGAGSRGNQSRGAGSGANPLGKKARKQNGKKAAGGREEKEKVRGYALGQEQGHGQTSPSSVSAKVSRGYADQIARPIRRWLLGDGEQVIAKETMISGYLWKIMTTSRNYVAKLDVDQESRFLEKLPHPHIIPFLGTISLGPDDNAALVMPEGYNWDQFRIVGGFRDHSFKSVIGLLSGVKFMHHHGVAHRDLKPENLVFLDSKVQIIDFGCATTEEIVGKDNTVGTDEFMAPEVSSGLSYDPKLADRYSAGVVVRYIANEAAYHRLLVNNLHDLSALLTKEKDSERLDLSLFLDFVQPTYQSENSERRIDDIIGLFVKELREFVYKWRLHSYKPMCKPLQHVSETRDIRTIHGIETA